MKNLMLILPVCLVCNFATAEDNSFSQDKRTNLYEYEPESNIVVAQYDETIGACRQYYRLGNKFIQCNMIPREDCHGNPLIRYEWDPSGSC